MNKSKKKQIQIDSDDDDVYYVENDDIEESEFEKQCSLVLDKITKNYKEQKSDIKELIKLYKNETKQLKKNQRIKKIEKCGFTNDEQVPQSIAKFLKLDLNSKMPRTELTKLFYEELKNRKLCYEQDKRVFRADTELKKLFNLPDTVNDSIDAKDKTGLNFFNLQTYIAKCYPKNNNIDK
jgi:hypothetical protein